jgi:uncharacterized membrane protein
MYAKELARRLTTGRWSAAWSGIGFLAAGVVAILLLFSSYCAFTHFRFGTSGDYIHYTNMIWNSGHGDLFMYGAGLRSYLTTHLSFSLPLLAPLFWIWNDPFLLSVVQWLSIVAGAVILVAVGRRCGVPSVWLAAVSLFWMGYHFTQSVQLCEFHGTSMYYLLLPWLYACLRLNRKWAVLPVLLLCGLREEGAMYAIPLLLWFALKDRWWPGYVLSAFCLAYTGVAVWWIFPLFSGGKSAVEMRDEVFGGSYHAYAESLGPRLVALAWALAPILPLLGRRRALWVFLVLLPLPLLVNLLSHWDWQYRMRIHYPAAFMATLGVALLEAVIRSRKSEESCAGLPLAGLHARALGLALVTAFSFVTAGFLHGSMTDRGGIYTTTNQEGRHALYVARHYIPRTGVLTTEWPLLGFAANRKDAIYGRLQTPSRSPVPLDVAFFRLERLPDEYRELLQTRRWGVHYYDARFVVLDRRRTGELNDLFLTWQAEERILFGYTRHWEGSTYIESGFGPVRYWAGRPDARKVPVSLGGEKDVKPGRYYFDVCYRTLQPPDALDATGSFILNDTKLARHVLSIPIGHSTDTNWRVERIEYVVENPTRLELQVMGGAYPLWLRDAVVIRDDDELSAL